MSDKFNQSQFGQGLHSGMFQSFGLEDRPPGKTSALDAIEQIAGHMGDAGVQSAKEWGPLMPIDMVAKGIEATASQIQAGAKDVYGGATGGGSRQVGKGIGEITGSIGQLLGGERAVAKIPEDITVPKLLTKSKLIDRYDGFINARGYQVQKAFNEADRKVSSQIGDYTKALDNAIPKDGINANKVLADAKKAVDDVVKTPGKYPPEIQAIAQSIKNHPPGNWDFETAKQFRTNINSLMRRSSGPMNAAASQIYKDLTSEMASAAKKAGGEKAWDFYNELTRKHYQQYGDLLDSIGDSKSGHVTAGHLLKDKSLTNEMVKNLSNFGLDSKDITSFIKQAEKLKNAKADLGRGLIGYIYGRGALPGLLTAGAMKTVGFGYAPATMAGILVGMMSKYVKTLRDLGDYNPKIVEDMAKQRSYPQAPGMPYGPATPSAPQAGAKPTPGTPPSSPQTAPQAPAATIRPLTKAEKSALRAKKTGEGTSVVNLVEEAAPKTNPSQEMASRNYEIQRNKSILSNPNATTEERASASNMVKVLEEQNASTTGTATSGTSASGTPSLTSSSEPTVTKVPEGEHGKGKLAIQAKDRERVAASRKKAASESVLSKAVVGSGGEVGGFEEKPIIEIEQDLKSLGKGGEVVYSALQKMRKQSKWDEGTYRGYLMESFTNAVKAELEKQKK
jgi:hypothetical protein